MPSQNEAATNQKARAIIKTAKRLIFNQIANSVLSKQGKTTLTGIFEGTPQNAVVKKRGYSAPGTEVRQADVQRTIDEAAGTAAKTYLESLKNKKS